MGNRTVLGFCGVAMALSACADNETSLFVEGILLGDPPECEYRADPGSARLFSGIMDVSFTTEYQAVLLVGNRQIPRGSKEQLRTETMGVQVRGAEVRLSDSEGRPVDEYSVPSSGYVAPTTAEAPGYGASVVALIAADTGRDLRAELEPGEERTIVADVRVFGETGGGDELTSGSTNFVIRVCRNCLRVVPEDPEITCTSGSSEGLVNGCFTGQDAHTDCRFCATNDCVAARP